MKEALNPKSLLFSADLSYMEDSSKIEFLQDVSLEVRVEFGRIEASIRQILGWKPGSVLVLNKIAGEPLDFRANGNLVAAGEAVIVNDKFGIRITEITDPEK